MSDTKRARLAPEADTTAADTDVAYTDATTTLANVQLELERVHRDASEKILAVERESNQLKRPFYHKRGEAIAQIAGFWRDVLQEHEHLQSLLTDEDSDLLGHLTQMDVEDFPDIKSGYRLTFTFGPNAFFNDTQLVRELHWDTEDGHLQITAPQPQWKAGKDYTQPVKRKRGTPAAPRSFMRWLTSEEVPGEEDEIAEIIKNEIWPNPLKLFLPKDGESDSEEEEDGSEDDNAKGAGVVDLTVDDDERAANGQPGSEDTSEEAGESGSEGDDEQSGDEDQPEDQDGAEVSGEDPGESGEDGGESDQDSGESGDDEGAEVIPDSESDDQLGNGVEQQEGSGSEDLDSGGNDQSGDLGQDSGA
ncbi:hypothetical protein WJX72_007675 [[Myrmecia] bisecta]|uniref:Nucleosome assembly protein n=1 Tax=[Myrmecia] bisecta TaxID=41462 RepID=A0AAW1R7Y7_9CHLO